MRDDLLHFVEKEEPGNPALLYKLFDDQTVDLLSAGTYYKEVTEYSGGSLYVGTEVNC